MKKDWVLTAEAFAGLLSCLDADTQRAAEKYEKIRRKLVKFFKWRGCITPEEYTDRTIDQVARRIAEGVELRVNDPYPYFHWAAINIFKQSWREPDIEPLELLPASKNPAVHPVEVNERELEQLKKEQRLKCLDRCLQMLPPETLSLITAYHDKGFNKTNRKQLAEALKVPINALRIRAYRIRLSLEGCVTSCLKPQSALK